MKKSKVFLALDLGAESGRAMAGQFDGRRLSLSEIHRFPNRAVSLPDGLYWDALSQFTQICDGLQLAATRFGATLVSAGVDTWGVDFGLLDRHDALLGNPGHYRDPRTNGEPERVFKHVPRADLYRATGNQIMQINTLFQLTALARRRSPRLEQAKALLFMPDLFHFWLTGRKTNESTIASTSQCFHPKTGAPARAVLRTLGLNPGLFQPRIRAGERIGPLLPDLAAQTGASRLMIVAPGTHDTASAVAAAPLTRPRDAFLSSGTWSILGMELDRPCVTGRSAELNFTNEGGVCGRTRLMKNIMGLWLLQESRRTWAAAGETLSYEQLSRLGDTAPAFRSLIDPNHPMFLAPGDMPSRIRRFCRETGQPAPRSTAEFVRTILESLALAYARVLVQLRLVTGHSPEVLHVFGGGSQNETLNRFAAAATGLPVVVGPVEATAAGNVLMQMMAAGEISSLEEGREIIRRSFPIRTVPPGPTQPWQEAAARFERIGVS